MREREEAHEAASFPASFLQAVDDWRHKQSGHPSRSDAIQQLVMIAIRLEDSAESAPPPPPEPDNMQGVPPGSTSA
jgi:hypothetical protein